MSDMPPVDLSALAAGVNENGGDAKVLIADAIVRSGVQFDDDSVSSLMFLRMYCGSAWTDNFYYSLLTYKEKQTSGWRGQLVDALKALSLVDFMQKIPLNLGGK